MRHWIFSGAIGVAAAISASSASAVSEQDIVAGIYVLDEKRSDNAFKAIDDVIAGLPDAKRPLARSRLRKSIAVDIVRISKAGKRFGIAYDAKTPIVVWISEEPIRWKLIEELVFDVSAKADGNTVILNFHGDDSDRITSYQMVGLNLVENTKIAGLLTPTPIIFRRVYSRMN